MCVVELLKQAPHFSLSFVLMVLVNPAPATEVEPTPQNRQPMLQMTSLETNKPTDRSKIHQLIKHIRKKYQVSKSRASTIVTAVFRSSAQHGLESELIFGHYRYRIHFPGKSRKCQERTGIDAGHGESSS